MIFFYFVIFLVPAQVVHTSPPYARQEIGKDVGLICSIVGTSPLNVKWFKNGAIISETQNGMLITTMECKVSTKMPL